MTITETDINSAFEPIIALLQEALPVYFASICKSEGKSQYETKHSLKEIDKIKQNLIDMSNKPEVEDLNNSDKEDSARDEIEHITKTCSTTKFIPPSIKQVRDYCIKCKLIVDPEEFWHYYNGVGWTVGKKNMKSWQSALMCWDRRRQKEDCYSGNYYMNASF